MVGCSRQNVEEELLSWNDPGSKVQVSVRMERTPTIHNYTYMQVSKNSSTVKVLLDDDVGLATMRIVLDGDWVMILNDNYVMGGYNRITEVMIGENQWGRLPYTKWNGSGDVVAQKKVGQTDKANIPAQYPIIEDQN